MTAPQSVLTVICAAALAATGCVRTVDGAISPRRVARTICQDPAMSTP